VQADESERLQMEQAGNRSQREQAFFILIIEHAESSMGQKESRMSRQEDNAKATASTR